MIIRVSPSTLRGEVQAPPSKSVMQRLVAGALLAEGTSTLHNISQSDDCTSALMLAAQLGAEIELDEQSVRITGVGGKLLPRTNQLTPGESGLAARLFAPIAGLADIPLEIVAERSLQGRPMGAFEKLFAAFGGKLTTTDGTFPVSIDDKLRGGVADLTAPISSQFTTGILFAMPLMQEDASLVVNKSTSTPYLDMTLEILTDFGIQIDAHGHTRYACASMQSYQPIEAVVDGASNVGRRRAGLGVSCLAGEGHDPRHTSSHVGAHGPTTSESSVSSLAKACRASSSIRPRPAASWS